VEPENSTRTDYWFLEGYLDEQRSIRRIPVDKSPFRVGRHADTQLQLPFPDVSRLHAELLANGLTLKVRDLGSRNGTFVNRRRISAETELASGDVLHIGNSEFRIGCKDASGFDLLRQTSEFAGGLSELFPVQAQALRTLIETGAVVPLFQPIVRLEDGTRFAYEVFGRGCPGNFATDPNELFTLARSVGLEQQLSRLFRSKGVEMARQFDCPTTLFLNMQPFELRKPETLVQSLGDLRKTCPEVSLAIEIPEALVTDFKLMQELHFCLGQIGVGVAYKDFGAGQARLMEISEVPPDYLKLHRSFAERLDTAPPSRRQMVSMLVKFARDMGAMCIAQGVERVEEADACAEAGFLAAQGFYFGKPSLDPNSKAQETGPGF
jgi:EAL domain-containing protein (putative c-di-GMP-specific phosphodiesterase class I)